jgi:hypothetical protein
MLTEQGRRCAVSGLDFSFKEYPDTVRHPFGPSIDRKCSSGGYDPNNVRLVCAAANIGLGQWGDEVFLPIARGAVDTANAALAAKFGLQERLDAAIDLMESMRGADRRAQARRVAALRRAVTLGPEGLSRAAQRAWKTRRAKNPPLSIEPKP